MGKALKFVRLDFLTVRPYFSLKNLALMLASPLFILLMSGVSGTASGMFIAFGALYISYPFAICEKNGMDGLYVTLSIPRRAVVLGRYLFALCFQVCTALLALGVTAVTLPLVGRAVDWGETLATLGLLLVMVTLVAAVQLPIYFKLGYNRAKMMAVLPFLVLMGGIILVQRLLTGERMAAAVGAREWLSAHTVAAVCAGALLWAAVMAGSYRASLALYRRREL